MSSAQPTDDREANVGFANDLLDAEIGQRNARKDAQESTARWIVLTVVALMTLLLTLAARAGILTSATSAAVRALFVATLAAAAITAACAGGTLWPRRYERLGGSGLDQLNQSDFLDRPTHEVRGRVVATQIGIAKRMDVLHEAKANWLKAAFIALGITLLLVIAQGVALGISPTKTSRPPIQAKIGRESPWRPMETQSCPRRMRFKAQLPIGRCRAIR